MRENSLDLPAELAVPGSAEDTEIQGDETLEYSGVAGDAACVLLLAFATL